MKTLAKIEKNPAEEIRFSLTEWKSKKYVDIRIWIKADPGEGQEEIPTKKGIRFLAELIPEFIKILQKIDEKLACGESAQTEGMQGKAAETPSETKKGTDDVLKG
jgi:hypothetical protein